MGLRGVMIGGAASMALLAGCGGSSHNAGTTHSATTSAVVTTAPATASAPKPAITHRLLTRSEMPNGFTAQGDPSVSPTIAEFLQQTQTSPGQLQSETSRLKRIGFVTAASQNLNGAGGGGISLVEQFRSQAGARAELANSVASFADQSPVRFSVRGIPGSTGFGGVGTGQGVNVAFADGDYYYLVGEQPNGRANRAGVIKAAQELYHRVHG